MTAQKSTFQPGVEALEDRCVPTTAKITNGVLFITGTPKFDVIHVGLAGPKIRVNGVQQAFRANAVQEIVIDTRGGHDKITLAPRLTMPAVRIDPGSVTILRGFGNATTLTSSGHATTPTCPGPDTTPTDSGNQDNSNQQLNDSVQQSVDYVNQIYQNQQQYYDYLNSIQQTLDYVNQINQDQPQLNDNSNWQTPSCDDPSYQDQQPPNDDSTWQDS